MNKDSIKEFKCIVCGKKFTELTPIHEKRCICENCYDVAIAETYDKGRDVNYRHPKGCQLLIFAS